MLKDETMVRCNASDALATALNLLNALIHGSPAPAATPTALIQAAIVALLFVGNIVTDALLLLAPTPMSFAVVGRGARLSRRETGSTALRMRNPSAARQKFRRSSKSRAALAKPRERLWGSGRSPEETN